MLAQMDAAAAARETYVAAVLRARARILSSSKFNHHSSKAKQPRGSGTLMVAIIAG